MGVITRPVLGSEPEWPEMDGSQDYSIIIAVGNTKQGQLAELVGIEGRGTVTGSCSVLQCLKNHDSGLMVG